MFCSNDQRVWDLQLCPLLDKFIQNVLSQVTLDLELDLELELTPPDHSHLGSELELFQPPGAHSGVFGMLDFGV